MSILICCRIGLAVVLVAGMAAPVAAQASGNGAAASVPGLSVTNVRVFATGSPLVAKDDREYRTVFASERTTLLGIEVHLRYTAVSSQAAPAVACTFMRSDGSVFRERSWTSAIQPGWTGSYTAASVATNDGGVWPPDSYRVTCNVAGRWSDPLDFRIESSQLRNVRGEYLRFFESRSTLQPRNEREYRTSFDVAALEWLGLELSLRYDVPGYELAQPMRCTFVRSGGSFSYERTWTASIQATWSAHFSSANVNMRNTGPWEPGRYRVNCDVGDQWNVAAAEFTLTGSLLRPIAVCVVADGALRNVQAMYNPATGDTTVNGAAFRQAYPNDARYAAGATWYIANDPIEHGGRRYEKYGLPRVLGVNEVTGLGAYRGVQVFGESGRHEHEVIYVPVRTGCEFQPYSRI